MAKHIFVVAILITLIPAMVCLTSADIPQLISFQGKLYDDAGDPLTGGLEVTFRIYDVETGGTALWSETINVDCDNGLYNVILGQTTALNLDFDGQYWLGVQVTGDDELSPRYRLASVPTAFRAQVANQVSWTNLTDVPAGFADGIDDVGEAGGVSQIDAGNGIEVTNPTGPTATVAADIGTGSDQVASGDHNHDDHYVNEGQTNSITTSMIVDEAVTSSKIVIPLILGNSVESPQSIISGMNDSETGFGVYGKNDVSGNYGYLGSEYYGTAGVSTNGPGVYGSSSTLNGVYGLSQSGHGVRGYNTSSENEGHIGGPDYAVYGQHISTNYGYLGSSNYGMYGQSNKVSGYGVLGVAHSGQSARGVKGMSDSGTGVEGSGYRTGVYGYASKDGGSGVYGICTGEGGTGVLGAGDVGVDGTSTEGTGVHGDSYLANAGVFENTNSSNAWSTLYAKTNGPGWAVHGHSTHGDSRAGYFEGNLVVTENLGIGTETPNARFHIDDESDTPGQGFRIGSGAVRCPETGTGDLVFDTYQPLPFVPGWHQRMIITSLGLVGIGTSTPSTPLDVNGTVEASELALNATSDEGDITSADRIIGYNDLRFYGDEGDLDIRITPDGNVGIGTSSPDYKLDVDGDINTTGEVRRNGTAYNNPDYVFEPTYELMSLKELKAFITEKKHLPNMPSSEKVQKEGVKIFEQNRLMLEKLEEAYLYIFELEERIARLEETKDQR